MTYFDNESLQRSRSPRMPGRTIALLVAVSAQAVVLFLTGVTMYFRPLSTAGCVNQCDYHLMSQAVYSYFIVTVSVTLIGVAMTVLLRRRGWWVLMPPALATLAVCITFFVTEMMARHSLGL